METPISESFPEQYTGRLRLRQAAVADIPALLRYANNPRISDQILNIPYPYREADAVCRLNFVFQAFKNKERFVFAITFKDKDELIGEIGLHLDSGNDSAQLGYWVAEPFWGQGIATEASSAVLKFGFETLGLNKIYATHYPQNLASGAILKRIGMIREAEMKDHYKVGKEYRTVIQYRLTKEEYARLQH